MDDPQEAIRQLLTEIRDVEREALDLVKLSEKRQQAVFKVMKWTVGVAAVVLVGVLLPLLAAFFYLAIVILQTPN